MTPADEPPTVTQAPADSRGSFDHSLPIETVAFPGSSGMAGEPVRPVQLGDIIAGRYELVSEIGSGGMGVIYAARDRVLNRDVAVKLLIDRFSAQSNTARRFVEEAQIASQLQHPGVAPVHDLGTLPNGRPFLVMKLIKGRTLAEILSREKPQTSTLVEWFHGIARTIAYAHNKSVIHRDLKPSNVMVGAFGEIQVMDWGLAKLLTESPSPSESHAKQARDTVAASVIEIGRTPDSATLAGSIMGTPAYMPPEQAKGDVGTTDERSDVFALGAILCELLTGKPPYTGSFDEIRAQSIIGLTQPALDRLAACGADEELIRLATACLATDPTKRPANGAHVERMVSEYRSGVETRLQQSEKERAAAEVQAAEQSKRRRVIQWASGAVAALLLVVIIGTWIGLQKTEAARVAAVDAQRDAEAAQFREEEQRKVAERNGTLAQARLEKAVEAVEQVMVRVAGEKWALRPELQKERREVLEEAIAFFQGLGTDESKDPTVRTQAARANLFAATAYISLAEYDKVKESVETSRTLLRGLQAEFPQNSWYLRGEAEAESLLGHVDAIKARFTDALSHYEAARGLAQKAVDLDPKLEENQLILADSYSSLALFYSFQRPDLSREYHRKALAIGELLLKRPLPSFRARLIVATASVNIAVSEMNNRTVNVKEKFDRAEEQIAILNRIPPPTARTAEMLLSTRAGLKVYQGVYLVRQKKMNEGIALTREGVDLLQQMLVIQPKSFPFQIQHIQFQVILADLLLNNQQLKEARDLLMKVKAEQQDLARKQPQLTWIQGLGSIQQSVMLIHAMREKYSPEFEESAKLLLDDNTSSVAPALKYNIACLYAQAVQFGPREKQEEFSLKAMSFLIDLMNNTDYFRPKSNILHLDGDTDLDPIRNRPDYRKFRIDVEAQAGNGRNEESGSQAPENPMPPGKK